MIAVSSIEDLRIVPLKMSNADKVMHVLEYAVWAVLFLLMMKQEKRLQNLSRTYAGLFFFGATLALLDEIHQGFIKGRECDLVDFIADVSGLALVILISYLINKLQTKRNYNLEKNFYRN